jgi:putative tryptophan/tyrosine transport system substrate-binding protein
MMMPEPVELDARGRHPPVTRCLDLIRCPPHHPGMDRRRFLLTSLAGALVAPVAAGAQQAGKVVRIGYVSTNVAANPHVIEAFRQGLRDLGYFEGHNLAIEYRSAEGVLERFPALASELVAVRVDVIVAANTQAALAAKRATGTIPIVFAGPPDPVSSRLVASLARPGGNVTGLSSVPAPEFVGKPLELLTLAVPGRGRIAALWHRDYPAQTQKDILRAIDTAARTLPVHLQPIETRGGPESFERASGTHGRTDCAAERPLRQRATTPCGPGG